MRASLLIVVADRGGVKAYRAIETPGREPSLQLVDDFQITGAEPELPVRSESSAPHVRLPSDWSSLEAETARRVGRQLADRMVQILARERTEGWALAAEPSIHRAIVDLLPAEMQERIVEHVPSDLMKLPPAKLQSHFRSLRSGPAERLSPGP